MISLQNGSRKRRIGIKIREECSSQSCTASRRTSGVIKSPTVRNRTSAICVKRLWISQGRFTTESALPVQTLGHVQHTCKAISEIHTMAHYRCWRLIHTDLSRLAFFVCRFICMNNEKASVQSGLNWLRNSQRYSITVWSKRYGMQHETRRCNVH